MLADSGLAYTVLRPNLFMDMAQRGFLGVGDLLQCADECEHPFAEASISMIDVRDVSDVAMTLLCAADPAASPYCGRALDLTGPEPISFGGALAAAVSEVRPRAVAVRPCAVEDFLSRSSLPPAATASLAGFLQVLKTRCAGVTDDVERITGKPARTIAEHVAEHKDVFLPQERDAERNDAPAD